jgi:hypothetical protein
MQEPNWKTTLEGKTEIPGFIGYYIDPYGGVFTEMSHPRGNWIYRLKSYFTEFSNLEHVYLPKSGKKSKSGSRSKNYIFELIETTFPLEKRIKKIPVIKYQSESGRKPLKRQQVLNHLLQFHPTVQISLTKNAGGVYETSAGMKDMGIVICESCGYPQNVEVVICKECSSWMVKR